MSEAVLRFTTAGGQEAAREVGRLKAVAKAAERETLDAARAATRAQTQAARDAAREKARLAAQSARDQARAAAQAQRAAEAAAKAETRAKLRAQAEEKRARTQAERDAVKAARDATRIAEREAKARGRAAQQEARELERTARALVVARERAEREQTAAVARENARREALVRRGNANRASTARSVVQGVAGAVSTGAQVASTVHGELQDARATRAVLQGTVMGAVSQVGVTDTREINALTDRVIATAVQHGLSADVIAQAVAQSQTEFSTLGGMEGARTPEARAQVFQGALDTAVQGRNLGVDPAEFSRLMGMLGQRGLDSGTREFLAAWTVGAAQRGAVEPGAVTREAMGPIIQRMSAAMSEAQQRLGSSATPEARQQAAAQAARTAYQQAFAELQVMRSLGESVRASGNALAGLDRALSNAGNVARMRGNVAHIADPQQRARVQTALFDRQGNLRDGLADPVRFTAALMGAGMTDPAAISNLFAGTGAGNPMGLQANFRRMVSGLSARDTEGRTGVDRVNALTQSSVALSPERRAAMRAMYEGSETANLARNEAARLQALTDNTTGLTNLSNRLAEWTAANPLASKALAGVGGFVASKAATNPYVAGGLGIASTFLANAYGAITGRTVAGRQMGTLERVGRIAAMNPVSMALAPALLPALGTADIGRAVGNRVTGQRERGPDVVEALASLPARLAAALRESPLTATVSPSDAVHATTVRTTTPSAP